eukprot:gene2595-5509_t
MDKNLLIDLNEGLKQDDYHHLIQSEPNQDSNSTSSSHQMLDQECEPQQRHALNQDFQTAEDLLSFAGDGDASEVLPALQPDESFFSNNADELMPTTVLSNGYSQTNSATEDSDKIQITAEQSDQSVMINENDVNEATVEKTFNFQDFLQKMRSESAYSLITPVKQFITDHAHPVHDPQIAVPVVRDFLDSLKDRVAEHELWKDASSEELDNANEGMEKYILSKLYRYYFQPDVCDEALQDQALADRMKILSFIRPEHLDIPEVCLQYHDQLAQAQTELIKMDSYKAPRDKAICIMNAVKLVMAVLEQTAAETGADTFTPLMTYVVLQAQPPNLIGNLRYVERFRDPNKLRGEMEYYLTNVMVCTEFIKKADASRFNIDRAEFEEQMTKQLEEMHPENNKSRKTKPTRPPPPPPQGMKIKSNSSQPITSKQHDVDMEKQPSISVLYTASTSDSDNAVPSGKTSPTASFCESNVNSSGFPPHQQSPIQEAQSHEQNPSFIRTTQEDYYSTLSNAPGPVSEPASIIPSHHRQQQQQQHQQTYHKQAQEMQPLPVHTSRDSPILPGIVQRADVPPIARFLTADPMQLTLGDILVLLEDYKRIARLNEELTRTLNLNLGL